MTIRVPCPECQRNLKFPDIALGKKVQCPVCGARFLGASPPSPPPAPAAVEPAPAPFPNMQLDDPPQASAVPLEAEPLEAEPLEVEAFEEEPLDPIVVEDEEAVEVEAAEVVEAVPAAKPATAQPAPKKSRKGLLIGCLAVGAVLLLACGGGGYAVYRVVNGDIADGDWKPFMPPEGRCSVQMPGDPELSYDMAAGVRMTKYELKKPLARSYFALLFYDLPPGALPPGVLDKLVAGESTELQKKLSGRETARRNITLGNYPGREFTLELASNRMQQVRFYLVSSGGRHRVYELAAAVPRTETGKGSAARFFSSFLLLDDRPVRPGPQPGPGRGKPPRK